MKVFRHHTEKDIHYRICGEGDTVLLLHGFGEDGQAWDELLSYLSGPYRLFIPDIPGSGRSVLSDPSTGAYSIDALAENIMALVNGERHTGERMVIAGHSMGGYIALAIAEKYPEKVAGLALVHSTAYADSEEKKAIRKKSIAFIQEHGSEKYLQQSIPGLFGEKYKMEQPEKFNNWVSHYAGMFNSNVLQGYLNAMRQRPDRTAVLKNLQVPLAFVIGDADQAVSPMDSLAQANMARQAITITLEQTGHMGIVESPARLGPFLNTYFTEAIGKSETH